MKIQWLLVAALLLVSLASEAQDVVCTGAEYSQGKAADIAAEQLKRACHTGFLSEAGKKVKASVLESAMACEGKARGAKNNCLSCVNSGLQKTIGTVSTLVAAGSAVTSMTASCSKFQDILKIAQVGLAGYNALCGMAQQGCNGSCKKLTASLGTGKGDLEAAQGLLNSKLAAAQASLNEALAAQIQLEIDLTRKDQLCLAEYEKAVTLVEGSCSGYKSNMIAAAANLAGIIASSAMAGQCKKETTASVDCIMDPMNAACTKALDCSLAENSTNTTCICQKAPNTAGCPGYTGSNGNIVGNTTDGSVNGDDLEKPTLNLDGANGNDIAAISPTSGGGGGNGVAPSGGGGGNSGLSGGGNAADGSKGKEKTKGLNANILSGYEGGGGGSFGSRGSSGSRDSDLQAYMPKGDKDPSRNPATQLFGNGQVTGAGSKSNFEKVNDRYGEAKSSLLSGQ